jgi:putative ABC transport system ATP-binding protein
MERSERARSLPRDLSGGQKQLVAIARALAGRTAIILTDEPMACVDGRQPGPILDVFARPASDEGRVMLIASHDPRSRAVAWRIRRIEDGLLIDESPPGPAREGLFHDR